MSAAEWVHDGDTWSHCDRPGWSSDRGMTCSKCQASFSWDDDRAPGAVSAWVFVNLETGTADDIGPGSFAVDRENLADDDRVVLEAADDFGHYGPEAVAVVERVGVDLSAVLDGFRLPRAAFLASIRYGLAQHGFTADDDVLSALWAEFVGRLDNSADHFVESLTDQVLAGDWDHVGQVSGGES